jgi:hypothetical protein
MRMLTPSTSARLFATGFVVGPVVDSLHNQCLLKYDLLPISLEWPSSLTEWSDYPYLFCSSWTVPPLLGVAYVVLGGILPRLFDVLLGQVSSSQINDSSDEPSTSLSSSPRHQLQQRAVVAVTTTALIIKLSEFLETNPSVTDALFSSLDRPTAHLTVMLVAALSQWALLDGTLSALLAASITSIGGPLSELPFVANGFWEYLDQASDYFPLIDAPRDNFILQSILGDNYQDLALSSITGPCYFAVTMDAIALGRWFDLPSMNDEENLS